MKVYVDSFFLTDHIEKLCSVKKSIQLLRERVINLRNYCPPSSITYLSEIEKKYDSVINGYDTIINQFQDLLVEKESIEKEFGNGLRDAEEMAKRALNG